MKNPTNIQVKATFIGKNEFHIYKRLRNFKFHLCKYELEIDVIHLPSKAVLRSYSSEAEFLTDWKVLSEWSVLL